MSLFPFLNITSYSNSSHVVNNNRESTSDKSPSDRAKAYDDKLHKASWIIYESEKDLMYCKFCKKNNLDPKHKQSPWVIGRKVASSDNILRHEQSTLHSNSIKMVQNKPKNDEIYSHALEKEYSELLPLMTSSYWLAISYNAAIQIESLSNLFMANNIRFPQNFCNDKGVVAIQRCISISIQKKLIKLINDNRLYYSILIDESTDISISKHLIVYVKYLDNWEPKTSFLGLVHVDSCDAASIVKSLIGYLMKKELKTELFYGFTSDGASVMLGCDNGVAAILKQEVNPLILNIHCVAHRIELAAIHSVKVGSELKEHEKTINEVAAFFHCSPKRLGMLQKACEQLSSANNISLDFLTPKSSSHTRWLSIYDSTIILLKIYPAIILVINTLVLTENKKTAIAIKELRDKIKSVRFIVGLFLFKQYLEPIKFMCVNFQKEDITLARMIELVNSTIYQLEKSKSVELEEHLAEWKLRKENGFEPLFKLYKHCNLIGFNLDIFESLNLLALQYKKDLIQQIVNRFPNEKIFSALTIFDIKEWPIVKNGYLPDSSSLNLDETLIHYGETSINTLSSFFRSLLNTDSDEIVAEWRNFKAIIHHSFIPANKKEYLTLTNSQIYRYIYSEYSDTLANILKLANIYLTVSVSSASCERGFSTQNLVKTPLRNRMTTPTLDSCIRIISHRIPVNEFDFRETYQIWKSLDSKQSIISSTFDNFIFSEAQQEQLNSIAIDEVLDFKINAEDVQFSPSVKDLIAFASANNNNVAPIQPIIEPIDNRNNSDNKMEIESNVDINIISPPSDLIPPPPIDSINNQPISSSNSNQKRKRKANSKYAYTP